MGEQIVHLFPGYHDGEQDVLLSQLTECCGKWVLDADLAGSAGTVSPAACTCPALASVGVPEGGEPRE